MADPATSTLPDIGNINARRPADLAMKGGVTSGVVYPKAIAELSRGFTFMSIGGTSAGAIAAALTAAAEYCRRQGYADGFKKLDDLPQELRQEGYILKLFRPDRATRGLFAIVTSLTGRTTAMGKLAAALRVGAVHWPTSILSALPGVALSVVGVWLGLQASSWTLALLSGFAGLVLAVGGFVLSVLWSIGRELTAARANSLGICSGMAPAPAGEPQSLTAWLSAKIDDVAGITGRPLTFGDLWTAPLPEELETCRAETQGRSIDLRTVTTCLSQGRPYSIPMETRTFLFLPSELRRLFPKYVVDWMVQRARPRGDTDGGKVELKADTGEAWLGLPNGEDLPVIVAARMSLSFPLLISAVPLWAVDYDLPVAPGSKHRPQRAWFSDGGLTCNFPVHFYDSAVPRWPTFGLNLCYFPKDPAVPCRDRNLPRASLPARNSDASNESWTHFARCEPPSVLGFFGLLKSSMQSWHDNSFLRLPAYRDRVADIWLTAEQGGMNLDMPTDVVDALVKLGADAGVQLRERFSNAHSAQNLMSWDNHRLRRAHVGLAALHKMLSDVTRGICTPVAGDVPLTRLLDPQTRPQELSWAAKVPKSARDGMTHLCDVTASLDGIAPFNDPPRPVAGLGSKAPI